MQQSGAASLWEGGLGRGEGRGEEGGEEGRGGGECDYKCSTSVDQ